MSLLALVLAFLALLALLAPLERARELSDIWYIYIYQLAIWNLQPAIVVFTLHIPIHTSIPDEIGLLFCHSSHTLRHQFLARINSLIFSQFSLSLLLYVLTNFLTLSNYYYCECLSADNFDDRHINLNNFRSLYQFMGL